MKILFLDDNHNRIDFAKNKWKDRDLSIAETAKEAIQLLKDIKFDIVSLDHDLGGKVYQQSGKGTGYEVAQFISKMKNPPPIVIVHSWNFSGAQNMLAELKDVTQTDYLPFAV